jgi:CHAT domain-containing protein
MPQIDSVARRLLWNVGANVVPTDAEAENWGESNSIAYDRQAAHDLYLQIVAPAQTVLQGKRHVYIAAGGSLSSLPFSMLVSAQPSGEDDDPAALRATRWLADDYALIQLPSLNALKFIRDNPGRSADRGQTPFVGFGNPVLEGRAESRGRGGNTSRSAPSAVAVFSEAKSDAGTPMADPDKLRQLARLPGTAQELEAMWEAFGSPDAALFLGSEATESAVKAASIDTQVLVFATHGLLASESSEIGEPGLVLTPPDQASLDDDGYLSSSEIAALQLKADWVILSACNTASGDGSRGSGGLSGVAKAFFYAGAQSLLASHWPVDDEVAAQMTVKIMTQLQADKSRSRAEAFQLAMREIRNSSDADTGGNTWAHPAAWAPFTLVGDGAGR